MTECAAISASSPAVNSRTGALFLNACYWPWLFSNSGREVKLSLNILAGSMVLSAVGACPPHDGVR